MRGLMEIWMANMDFQLVVDVDKAIAYMTKYVTKPEIEISSGMNKMIEQIINKSHVDGLTTKAILKKLCLDFWVRVQSQSRNCAIYS